MRKILFIVSLTLIAGLLLSCASKTKETAEEASFKNDDTYDWVKYSRSDTSKTSGIESSFDCFLAKYPLEQLICADKDFARYDKGVFENFNKRKELAKTEKEKSELIEEQKKWLDDSLKECEVPESWNINAKDLLEKRQSSRVSSESLKDAKIEDLKGDALVKKIYEMKICIKNKLTATLKTIFCLVSAMI